MTREQKKLRKLESNRRAEEAFGKMFNLESEPLLVKTMGKEFYYFFPQCKK
jgi:hypothetical protein